MSSTGRKHAYNAWTAAALWLPFLLGAVMFDGPRAEAQTSGLAAPMSGDCAVNAAGAVVCAKTNGAAFAPSATIDATNAANLLSGSIPLGRLGNVPNLVNPVPVPVGGGEYTFTDGAGTTVADSSGNGNTMTLCSGANAPTWYQYGLAFLDTGQPGPGYDCVMTPFTSYGTVYFATITPTQVLTTGTSASYGLPASNGAIFMGFTAYAGSGMNLQTQININSFQPSTFSGAGSTNTTDGYAGAHVYSFSAGTGGGSLDRWMVDGTEPGYATQVASASSIAISGGGVYELGTALNNTNYYWRGVVTYMIFYPGQHTAAQQVAVTRYIQAKLAGRAAMPVFASGTNTARTPQLVAAGDSLTSSQQGNAQWTTAVSTASPYTVINNGIAGFTAFDMCKMVDQQWGKLIAPGQTVVHFWAGTNDIANANRSPADVWASLVTCGLQARRYGARTVVATMIDRGGTGNGLINSKNALNTLIRSRWKSSGAFDAMNDLAELPALGADGSSQNTSTAATGCFSVDKVHLVGPGAGTCATVYVNGSASALSGYGLVAQLVSNSVDTLNGSSQANPDVTTANSFAESYTNNVVVQTPTAAATHSLVDCEGQASPRTVVNGSSTYPIVASGVNGQSITGNSTIAAQATGVFVPMLTSASTAGCSWVRMQ
ncbi:MAG: SGNH/GDSL hydrolase family protein [Janthinobacterium lividum]